MAHFNMQPRARLPKSFQQPRIPTFNSQHNIHCTPTMDNQQPNHQGVGAAAYSYQTAMETERNNQNQNRPQNTPSQSPPIGSFGPAQPQYPPRQQDTNMTDVPRAPSHTPVTPQTNTIRPMSAAAQYYPSHSPVSAMPRQTTPILPPMRQTTPILPPGMSRTHAPQNNARPVTPILPPQAQQTKMEATSNPGSRAASVHPESGPKMPEKAPAHGAPARQYLNTKVTGALLEGMKILAKEQ